MKRGLEECDVGSLRHGVAEEAEGNALALKATHLHLGLHRRVALHAADGDEVHEIGGELGEFGNLALDEEHAFLGIKAGSEVVESHLDDVLTDLLGVVGIIGEGLHVGHEHEHTVVVALILQLDTAAQRADVVSEMEFSGGAVTGEYYFSHYTIYDLQIYDLRFISILAAKVRLFFQTEEQ